MRNGNVSTVENAPCPAHCSDRPRDRRAPRGTAAGAFPRPVRPRLRRRVNFDEVVGETRRRRARRASPSAIQTKRFERSIHSSVADDDGAAGSGGRPSSAFPPWPGATAAPPRGSTGRSAGASRQPDHRRTEHERRQQRRHRRHRRPERDVAENVEHRERVGERIEQRVEHQAVSALLAAQERARSATRVEPDARAMP